MRRRPNRRPRVITPLPVLASAFASPLAPADERAYRHHFLAIDRRGLRLFAALSIAFNCLNLFVDWKVAGATPLFGVLLADRIVMFLLAGALIALAPRWPDLPRHDSLALGWGLSLTLCYLPILYSRPADFTANIVPDILIIVLIHFAMPDRPYWRILPGLAYSAVSLFGLFVWRNALPELTLWSVLTSYFFANLVGIGGGQITLVARRARWRAEQENVRLLAAQAQHAEMKNRLVSILSHEYRTPLNVIISSAALFDQYFERMEPVQRNAVLGRLNTGAARLTELLDRALHMVCNNSYRLSRTLVDTPVAQWISSTAKELHVFYPDCLIEKSGCDAAGSRPLDPFLLKLIVSNLLSNSYKFSPRTAAKGIVFACDPAALTISVSDAGPGIRDDEQARLFEPFFRGAASAAIQGSGMGLPIVKEAVDLLAGHIELRSAPGQTCFVVRLPWLPQVPEMEGVDD